MIKFYLQNKLGSVRCTDGSWYDPSVIKKGSAKLKIWKSEKAARRWIRQNTTKPFAIIIVKMED